ncbi:MAG: LysM peptidoglycan-binding domain-containing protein, partial [Ilumatobacteraceae bacterium]
MALLTLLAIVLVLLVGAGHVVANRGGAPASASMIRPATATGGATVAAAGASKLYVVHAGDTMWSIARRLHGNASLAGYLDQLIDINGGTEIQVSQALTLP